MSGTSSAACTASGSAQGLPHETTLHLLNFLDAVSLSKCAETYTVWRKLASADRLWHRLCKNEFGIDGGKADYASRWQQEKQRAFANLKLFIDFLDEIYFSLAGFFALMLVFVVFPVLLVLKIDGWVAISWTQVFGSIYGLTFIAFMFVLTRMTFLVTVLSPCSALHKCVNYGGSLHVVKRGMWNNDVKRKVSALAAASLGLAVVPFMIHMYADGYLPTPRLAVFLVWLILGCGIHFGLNAVKTRRGPAAMALVCSFASCSLLLAKVTLTPLLAWTAVICPFAAFMWKPVNESLIPQIIYKRLHGRAASHRRRMASNTANATTHGSYYLQTPPLVSLSLIALKLDGILSVPWVFVLLDYIAWVVFGPLAHQTRHLIQVMFREMPIPNQLRKL